jgi:rhamnosyl/mannosyltransferase
VTVLELGKFYPPARGGIETLLGIFCEGFAKKGAAVRCVVANTSGRTVRENVRGVGVTRCASFGSVFSTSLCPGYVGEARKSMADIWHAHFPNPLADVAVLRAPKKARLVVTYHSDIIRQAGLMNFYGGIVDRVLARADKIVVATPRQIEFSPRLQSWRKKIEVIPFGIDLARLTAPAALPEKFAAPSRRPILLTVGRLVGYKGHRYLIEAMQNVDATLWIVGSGPLENELRREAWRLGVAERVEFFGEVGDSELPALYQACDVFVLPSISANEAFGIVQVEAMACGKPVISCDLKSGVPWVNQHEVTGLVVPPCEAQSLASAIKRVADDPSEARRLGDAGRERALTQFTQQRMVDDYYRLFESMTA